MLFPGTTVRGASLVRPACARCRPQRSCSPWTLKPVSRPGYLVRARSAGEPGELAEEARADDARGANGIAEFDHRGHKPIHQPLARGRFRHAQEAVGDCRRPRSAAPARCGTNILAGWFRLTQKKARDPGRPADAVVEEIRVAAEVGAPRRRAIREDPTNDLDSLTPRRYLGAPYRRAALGELSQGRGSHDARTGPRTRPPGGGRNSSWTTAHGLCVIGAGPAGSLFAYFCSRSPPGPAWTPRDIYESRDFHHSSPQGCNMCRRIVSESLVQNSRKRASNLPPTVVQRASMLPSAHGRGQRAHRNAAAGD